MRFLFLINLFLSILSICSAQSKDKHSFHEYLLEEFEGGKVDSIPLTNMQTIYFYSSLHRTESEKAAYNRLRNAVYVTYPYARKAGIVLNDINAHLEPMKTESERKKYINSREKELKKEFTTPLTNLSIYQGKVLMKLINRETGNNCYNIIKEYKSGFTARLYQTVAFFFNSNLKQSYDPVNDDRVIENLVKEVQRLYGYPEIAKGTIP